MSGQLTLGLGLGLGRGQGSGDGSSTLAARVFLLIGQSNMVGRPPFDGGAEHPSIVRQWGRVAPNDGVLIPATSPLQHVDPQINDMGLDLSFSIDWVQANPARSLILVPSAKGGSSLGSGDWQKGGLYYEDAVARANAAIAASPGAVFAGFLWHQGEADASNGNYQVQLDQMIADFRSDVTGAATVPFILGGFSDIYVGSDPNRAAMRNIVLDTPNRVSDTAVADASDLTMQTDNLHFDAAALRILGSRYFTTFSTISITAPSAVGVIPNQTDVLALAAPSAIGTIPNQTDVLALAPPVALGTIPDQTDLASLAAPVAIGVIPDQMDVAA